MLERLDHLFQHYVSKDYFPGAVCLIAKDEEIIFHQAYGHASTSPVVQKMKASTRFDIASLTKIVTTTIILRLITNGKLSLNQTLEQCLPKAALNPILYEKFSTITVKQLLTHNSGLIAWYPFYSQKLDFYDVLADVLQSNQEASGVVYSDLNFMLLGEIIKENTGLTLKQAVREWISKPLHMESMDYGPTTGADVAATEFGNQVETGMCLERGITFEGWREQSHPIKGEVNDGNAFYFFNGQAGHAGLFSNAVDLMKLGQLFIKGGEWGGERLIDQELVEISMTEQEPSRGIGWQISSLYPRGCGHTGFTGTSLWLVPEEKMVVVTLTNRLHMQQPIHINTFREDLHETIYNLTIGKI
jgi:CubicO group peptidase (beta-lactamase class C family)